MLPVRHEEEGGTEGASQLGFTSWARIGTSEVGGKDISVEWNSDKYTRAEKPELGSNPVVQRSWEQSI